MPRRDYDYAPDYDSTVQMAENRGGGFDNFYKEGTKLFKPHKGANLVRILPPGWSKPKHYGFPVYVHGNVGPNNRQYLCLLPQNNPGSPHKRCPVCDALYDLGTRATQQDRTDLKPKLAYLYYVVDRDAEKEGVQVWRTSGRSNSEIAVQSMDRRNRAVLNITHPDKGYDVEFTRVGEGRTQTRYHGFMVMRESSPLSDSDKRQEQWLDYVYDNPLPDILVFHKPERIEEEFYGRAREDEDPERATGRRANGRDDDDGGSLRRTRRDDEDEPRPARTRRDDDEELDRRARRDTGADAAEERPARTRRDDDEPRPARARQEDDEPRSARTRRNDELEERPAGRRSRTADELEDEIPSESRRRRANGAGDDEPAAAPRERARSDDEEENRPTERARRRPDDDDEPRPSRTRRDDEPEDRHSEIRARTRERLNRGD
jgi:hypothetical protein